jgi:hypothetical protein
LRWPRSTRYLGIQYTNSSPREPGPLTRPLEEAKGQGPWRGFNPAMPIFRAFDSWSVCGRLADSTASDRNSGTHEFTQVRPPGG